MAVLNATPDSFFDGGRYEGERAVARVVQLSGEGAFAVDIGGESTRPGAPPVGAQEQLARIEPALKRAIEHRGQRSHPWISVDTSDPAVAEAALSWGAHVINDVSCLGDPDLARVVAKAGAALLLMHARGANTAMAGFSEYPDEGYRDVVSDVIDEWTLARQRAVSAGMDAADVLFDPGLGFAKNARQSMELLRRIGAFACLGTPIVVGPSRKSFLKLVEDCPPEQRLGATIAACLHAAEEGVMMVRVHDVQIVQQALSAQRTIRRPRGSEEGPCSTAS